MLNKENTIVLSDAGETSAADVLKETMEYFGLSNDEVAKRVEITEEQLTLI
ncbi:hypothetical protein G6R29_03170 [Fructobacillus sp. M2-14]|uniref:Uncharacterized protein n=1 Tax=Fructobacillus broussonetiae TaxID=2713173 RepID=A0ABS5QZN5_9LACO|nr:hypothetical protein [Fructobacillus broussonetiae]MBS9338634.1 hypothetical protein [Fructobacillus broussonetiae]